MSEIKYQILKIKVNRENENIKFALDTDKKYKRITGIFASLPEDKNYRALFETTLELRVADVEIFPEGFEIKMLSCGQQVTPNDRFFNQIEQEARGNQITGRYIDGGNADKYPYVAKIYLKLEEKV